MTYKKMMVGVVKRDCTIWMAQFIAKKGAFAMANETTLKIEGGVCCFNCVVYAYGTGNAIPTYYVEGEISESGRVYKSIVRNYCQEIVWATSEELRALEGIENFQIN